VEIKGGNLLQAHLEKLAKRYDGAGKIRAGFLEGATEADGTSVATIAALNNFGASGAGIPPRPFFTNVVQREGPEWGAKLAKILEKFPDDPAKAMALMGEYIAGRIRQSIVDTNAPPNSPVTNLLKQRFPTGDMEPADVWQAFADVAAGATAPAGKPLVWSGTMLNSVSSEVVPSGQS
jgi:hypothetical protein